MRVADFGAGTGFYSRAASSRVGLTGRVYAIEVQKDLVKKLESDIESWGLNNIDCLWADIEMKNSIKIADGSLDAIIISNVLFQADDKLGLIDEAKRLLKKGGEILLIDWKESFNGLGPTPENIVTESRAQELFTGRGFLFIKTIPESPHHYGIIFKYESR